MNGLLHRSQRLSAVMRCLLASVLALTLFGVSPVPVAHASAIRNVSPAGADVGDCIGAPCATIAYAIGRCVAGDTIELAAGTYTEAGIIIPRDLVIRGQGSDNTIVQAHAVQGSATDRVFDISFSEVTLQDMTIQHGRVTGSEPGGGIYNNDTLTLDNVVVVGNSSEDDGGGIYSGLLATLRLNNTTVMSNTAASDGGGIDNAGALILNHSIVSGNEATSEEGGGIYNLRVVDLNDSLVSDNSAPAGYGGGIYNAGDLTVHHSTISGNTANDGGGGIMNSPNHSVALYNSTISGNRSNDDGGGILDMDGGVRVNNCTITGNTADDDAVGGGDGGGVITWFGYIDIKSTIIAGNADKTHANHADCRYVEPDGEVYSYGYNLVGQGTGCPSSGVGDQTTANPVDDLNPDLSDNGGPTQTHTLPPASQAIDAGSCTEILGATVDRDQRGALRPLDGDSDGTARCDVGAYELSLGTGPGGVGTVDGNSSLALWLRADRGVYQDAGCSDSAEGGDPVACWADQSGNGNHATQSTGDHRPILATGALNGRPQVSYDGANDLLATAAFSDELVQPNTALLAIRFEGDGQVGLDGLDATHRQQIARMSGQYALDAGGTPIAGGSPDADYHLVTGTFDGALSSLYGDGALLVTGDPGSQSMNGATLGASGSGGSYLTGSIAEAIVYGELLNKARRTLAENYLSAKYDLALDTVGGAKDVYAGDEFAKGDYDRDVAGIGKESDGLNPEAHSAGLTLINNPYLASNGDYVVVGHATEGNSETAADVTGDVFRRWERIWYLDRTEGSLEAHGDLKIAFDFSEGGLPSDEGELAEYVFVLLCRAGTAGDFVPVAVTSWSLVGDQAVFTIADANLVDGYYTLGYALGTTIYVNTEIDELNADGDCSLREAIQAANTDSAVDACEAGSGADTILLPAGTYTLVLPGGAENANATGDLDILEDLTINGAGADTTTIDGGGIDRVLDIPLGDPTVQLNNLAITDGQWASGGGINSEGTLTLNYVVVCTNTVTGGGGGINNVGGTLTLNDSTVRGNTATNSNSEGGGIDNDLGATTTLNRSSVSGNSAGYGGGIDNNVGPALNTLILNNSTVSGNSATTHGGGIRTLFTINGPHKVILLNSTIADNTADSDADGFGDGGGVYSDLGVSEVRNSIIAGNHDMSAGTKHPDWSRQLSSYGYTLVGDATGCSLSEPDNPGTNIVGVDPQLLPLADNGGETKTHALPFGSPALEVIPVANCPLATDQRGVARPQRTNCDMGAYERENAPPEAEDDALLARADAPTALDVLDNDTDLEGDPLSITAVGVPITGTATIANGATIIYTPTLSFKGTDVFTYTITDFYGDTDSATVTVTVGDVKLVYLSLILRSYQ